MSQTVELTDAQKDAIWDVLVEVCGAGERWRSNFAYHFPAGGEFRFQGDLGFGGKVWADRRRVYVDCYRENETPENLAKIERTNAELARIIQEQR